MTDPLTPRPPRMTETETDEQLIAELNALDDALSFFACDFCLVGNERVGRFRAALQSAAACLRAATEKRQRAADRDEYLVRVAPNIVQQLRAAPSPPVTMRIEEREGRELEFIITQHDCPTIPARPEQGGKAEAEGLAFIEQQIARHGAIRIQHWSHDGRRWLYFYGEPYPVLTILKMASRGGADESLADAIRTARGAAVEGEKNDGNG